MIVAYQGEPGAFSEDALRSLHPDAETRGYVTFDETFAAALTGAADAALLPVENSISGAVPRVYDLLWAEPSMRVVDEAVYRVVQNLIALDGTALEGIREVRSHPVALEQCRKFLAAHPKMHLAVVADTAGAVREIVALGDPSVAAIASELAAERYGAQVLAPAIQDVADNFTRGAALKPRASRRAPASQSSCRTGRAPCETPSRHLPTRVSTCARSPRVHRSTLRSPIASISKSKTSTRRNSIRRYAASTATHASSACTKR